MENKSVTPEISRRKFSKLLTFGGLAAICGAVWLILRNRPGGGTGYPERVIARVGEIPVGGVKIFSYPTDEKPNILIRTAADTYVAYSRLCTHLACPVFYRPESDELVCPCHQGFFSVVDGSVLAGPPPKPLPCILLERRGAEIVAIGIAKG